MTFKFKNTAINYNIYGSGPVLLLLHGFLESSKMWEPFIPKLKEKYKIVTMDFPGLGDSGIIAEVHSMELMADVVNSLLEELKIETAIFVGHSMGGYVSLACAELFPEKIAKLVLLNSSPLADSDERTELRNRALQLMDTNPTAFITMAISNWADPHSREQFAEEIEKSKQLAQTFPHDGIKAALRGMRDRKDRIAVLKNFPRSKILFLAKDDPIINVAENKALAASCGTDVKIVSGGHLSTIENPSAVMDFMISL